MAAQVRAGGLHKLRLSNNALQGPLPPLVESGNLTDIAVANNNLSGAWELSSEIMYACLEPLFCEGVHDVCGSMCTCAFVLMVYRKVDKLAH